MKPILYPQTPLTIRRAQLAQRAERKAFEQATGVPVPVHGFDVPLSVVAGAMTARGPFIIGCPRPGCPHTVSARSEGRALRMLAWHLVEHIRQTRRQES